jgi:hypothetical protein
MTDRGQAVGFRYGDGSCDGRSIPPQEKWGGYVLPSQQTWGGPIP